MANRKRQHKQLWDDALFRDRLAKLADQKGVSVREAMREIGFTVDYGYKPMEMRSSNMLMVLAEYFGVPPAYIAGWQGDPKPPKSQDDRLQQIILPLVMFYLTLIITHQDSDHERGIEPFEQVMKLVLQLMGNGQIPSPETAADRATGSSPGDAVDGA